MALSTEQRLALERLQRQFEQGRTTNPDLMHVLVQAPKEQAEPGIFNTLPVDYRYDPEATAAIYSAVCDRVDSTPIRPGWVTQHLLMHPYTTLYTTEVVETKRRGKSRMTTYRRVRDTTKPSRLGQVNDFKTLAQEAAELLTVVYPARQREADRVARWLLWLHECLQPDRETWERMNEGDDACFTATVDEKATVPQYAVIKDVLHASARAVTQLLAGTHDDNGSEASMLRRRLRIELATGTVTLDGKQYGVDDPKVIQVFQAICDAGGAWIAKPKIRTRVPGVNGQKTIPNLLDKLPRVLDRLVTRSNKGYCITLPLLKNS